MKSIVLIIVVAFLAITGFVVYKLNLPEVGDEVLVDENMGEEMDEKMSGETLSPVPPPPAQNKELKQSPAPAESSPVKETGYQFHGEVLAGITAHIYQYNQTDYDFVINSGKLIVLYFYANWCPICQAEFPKMQAAFNELNTDQVVGFRVNYNDNETDDFERALAREHGVAYQHTKVFVRNGERIGKWPDSWDKNRYLSEINSRL